MKGALEKKNTHPSPRARLALGTPVGLHPLATKAPEHVSQERGHATSPEASCSSSPACSLRAWPAHPGRSPPPELPWAAPHCGCFSRCTSSKRWQEARLPKSQSGSLRGERGHGNTFIAGFSSRVFTTENLVSGRGRASLRTGEPGWWATCRGAGGRPAHFSLSKCLSPA